MFNSKKPDNITHQLICPLCACTIENQKIIDSYKANRTLVVKHCIHCLTLQPPKNRSIRKRLKTFIKHPDIIRFICRDLSSQELCKECGSEYFINWNGFCPKCGETLYLKSK